MYINIYIYICNLERRHLALSQTPEVPALGDQEHDVLVHVHLHLEHVSDGDALHTPGHPLPNEEKST